MINIDNNFVTIKFRNVEVVVSYFLKHNTILFLLSPLDVGLSDTVFKRVRRTISYETATGLSGSTILYISDPGNKHEKTTYPLYELLTLMVVNQILTLKLFIYLKHAVF